MENKRKEILASAIKPKKTKRGFLVDSIIRKMDSDEIIFVETKKSPFSELPKSEFLKEGTSYLMQGIVPPNNIVFDKTSKNENPSSYFRAIGLNLSSRIFKLISLLLIVGLNLPGLSVVGLTGANFSDVEKTTNNLIDSSILDFSLVSVGWQPASPLFSGSSTTENVTIVDEDDSVDFKYIASVVETGGDHNFCEKLDLEASLEGVQVFSGDLLSFVSSNFNFGSTTDEWTFKIKLPAGESDVDGKKCEFDFLYRSWQNEFPVFPDGFHDEEKVHNVIEGGEVKDPNVCPWESGPGRVVVDFNYRYLRSDISQSNASDGPTIGYVPAGTYDITLASYDDHFAKPDQIQPQEQWKLIMGNGGGGQVAVTNSIRDIVDTTEEQVIEKVGNDFSVPEDIYQFTAFHSAYPNSNPNSVRALCAMFEGDNIPTPQEVTPPPAGRIHEGLLALYTFEENSGQIVSDVSGSGSPLNLWIPDLAKVSRVPGALSINSSTLVSSLAPALKLTDGLKTTNEITIEAWVKPANTTQDGPARIATLSQDTLLRNFTLAQEVTKYTGRLRTTTTGTNGIPPAVFTPSGIASTTLQHIVYTRTSSTAKIYVDGVEVASEAITGIFSNWDSSFRFGLANEFTMNRTWLGELHLVAIYNRDLSSAEVAQNFSAGADNQIVINEFLPNPTGSDDAGIPSGEWVELYNLSATPISVVGWTLYDNSDSNPVVITSSNSDNNGNTADSGETIVPAHGYLVVYLNGAYSEWLNNSGGDTVRLYSGTVDSAPLRDSYSYSGVAPENKSYARIPDGAGNFVDPVPTPLAPNKIEEEAPIIAPEENSSSSSVVNEDSEILINAIVPSLSFIGTNESESSSQSSSHIELSSNSSLHASSASSNNSNSSEDSLNLSSSSLSSFSSSNSSATLEIENVNFSTSSVSNSSSVTTSASSTETLIQFSSSQEISSSGEQNISAQIGSDSSGHATSSSSFSSYEFSYSSDSITSSSSVSAELSTSSSSLSSTSSSSKQSSASSTSIVKNDVLSASVESGLSSSSSHSSQNSSSGQLPQESNDSSLDNKAIVRENSDGGPQIVSGESPITD